MEAIIESEESGNESSTLKVRMRARSANRFFYEAQVEVIKRQVGDLDQVCKDLGLSQRKLAQLLLVDPSAMTRWNRPGMDAPPHIWRALQWYMTVREKIPGLTPQYFLNSNIFAKDEVKSERWQKQFKQELAQAHQTILDLQTQTKSLQKKVRLYSLLGVGFFFVSCILLVLSAPFFAT